MDLEYLDSVLVHWPNPSQGNYVRAWEGLVEAKEAGLVRSIGVSNFTPAHLDEIIAATGVTPASNQVEMHPAFPQVVLASPCSGHGYKFCSVLGEVLADLATGDGTTRHDIGFLRLGRFGQRGSQERASAAPRPR